MIVYIYGLVCPIKEKVMYVGKTYNMDVRLTQHLSEAKNGFGSLNGAWLRELQAAGLQPTIIEIEQCEDGNWREREKFWIEHYKSVNPEIRNTAIASSVRVPRPETTRAGMVQVCMDDNMKKALQEIAIANGLSLSNLLRFVASRVVHDPEQFGLHAPITRRGSGAVSYVLTKGI